MARRASLDKRRPRDAARTAHLTDPVTVLDGVGPKRAALLEGLGIGSVGDLLLHLPRVYDDRRNVTPICEVVEGEEATVEGEVTSSRTLHLRGGKSLAEITFSDGTASMKATFFGRGFLAKTLGPGTRLVVSGKVGSFKGLAFQSPEYEILEGEGKDPLNTGIIVPRYRLTEGLTQRMLRRWIWTALNEVGDQALEILPLHLRETYGYASIQDALRQVHFPSEPEEAERARVRFAYEELLLLQMSVLGARERRRGTAKVLRHRSDGPKLRALREALPFVLTKGQSDAVDDVLGDLISGHPMARLLQGDVGCGKTIVALHAVAACADGGFQTAFMAPTEVLAGQHYATLCEILVPLGMTVGLLTGSATGARQERLRAASGETHVVVGTHALFQDATSFRRLGLVIVDEQHRFGVSQREKLMNKGAAPDSLHMTATPIPRSLAMTLYGNLDLTVIQELPPHRQAVETRCVGEKDMEAVYAHVIAESRKGNAAFFVCPVIDDSNPRGLRDVTTHFESLSSGPFSKLRTAVVHGRMPGEEKFRTLRRLQAREIDVVFSTTVIEVGIDVAHATTIVIENAPNFGLSQLHQLRGRVGRGREKAYCFLAGDPATDEGEERMAVMCRTADGFEIAEADMALRGPGEVHGFRQAGLSDLRAADLVTDIRLLEHARKDAQGILEDPQWLAPDERKRLDGASKRFDRILV